MIIDNQKCRFGVTDLLLVIGSLIMVIGIYSWFKTCPVMGETIMACHWAGQAIKAVAILAAVLSLIHLIAANDQIKTGLDISLIGIYVVSALIPGRIIGICHDSAMHCRAATQPWTIALSIILILFVLGDILFYRSRANQQKHKRPE